METLNVVFCVNTRDPILWFVDFRILLVSRCDFGIKCARLLDLIIQNNYCWA